MVKCFASRVVFELGSTFGHPVVGGNDLDLGASRSNGPTPHGPVCSCASVEERGMLVDYATIAKNIIPFTRYDKKPGAAVFPKVRMRHLVLI